MIVVAEETMNDAVHLFGSISAQTQRIFFIWWLRPKVSGRLSWHYVAHCRDIGRLLVIIGIVQQSSTVLKEK